MGSKRLQNAAKAAGFAMVNPEDFEREAPAVGRQQDDEQDLAARTSPSRADSKSWLIWDYARLISGKATA